MWFSNFLIAISTGLLKLVVSPNVRLLGEIFRDLIVFSKNQLNSSVTMTSLEIVLSLFFKVILEDVLLFSKRKG